MKNLLLILIIVGVAIGGFLFYSNNKKVSLPEIQASKEIVVTETPTPTPAQTEISEVHSADGSMNLKMQKTEKEGVSYYSLSVSSAQIDNLVLYTRNLTVGSISLPQNSWSPDNKYFFIKENDGAADDYIVFKASGENFVDGNQSINILPLYTVKITQYGLRDITGWDAPGLLHVLTSGPSFWFDIGSKAFLQLSTK